MGCLVLLGLMRGEDAASASKGGTPSDEAEQRRAIVGLLKEADDFLEAVDASGARPGCAAAIAVLERAEAVNPLDIWPVYKLGTTYWTCTDPVSAHGYLQAAWAMSNGTHVEITARLLFLKRELLELDGMDDVMASFDRLIETRRREPNAEPVATPYMMPFHSGIGIHREQQTPCEHL